MKPSSFVVLPLAMQPKIRPMRPPRGDLVMFGINPFTYNVVFSYQDNHVAIEYIDCVIKQLHNQIMAMADVGLEPNLQSLLDWVKGGNTPPDGQQTSEAA